MDAEVSERDRLRSLVVDYCLEHGVATLTLRGVSGAVGTHNRMLLYYFESKERMIFEALNEALERFPLIEGVFEALADMEQPFLGRVEDAWRSISARENVPFLRLFFEIFGLAVRTPERYSHFIDSGRVWVRKTAGVLRAEGVPTAQARVLARELVALWRGLQFDLLSGGNRKAIQDTYDAAAREFARRVADASVTAPG